MKGHFMVSKASSKSKNRSNPGISFCFAKQITLSISRIFSAIYYLPLIRPVGSLLIRFGGQF